MKHRRVMAATIAVLALAGCSSEDVTESLIEQGIESQGGGEVDLDLDGGAVKIETEEGTVEFEASEDGSFSVTGPEGSVLMESDGDGMSITGGDQSFETSATSELPDDFPAGVPLPAGNLVNVTRTDSGDEVSFMLTYESEAGTLAAIYESLVQELTGAGYRSELEATGSGTVTAQFTDGTTSVAITGVDTGGPASWNYVVFPATP